MQPYRNTLVGTQFHTFIDEFLTSALDGAIASHGLSDSMCGNKILLPCPPTITRVTRFLIIVILCHLCYIYSSNFSGLAELYMPDRSFFYRDEANFIENINILWTLWQMQFKFWISYQGLDIKYVREENHAKGDICRKVKICINSVFLIRAPRALSNIEL